MASQSKYSIEVWTPGGQLLADLSGQANGIQIIKSRNTADDITFTLSLNKFEHYCTLLGVDPKLVLMQGSSEVRVKRFGTYVAGGQLTYKSVRVDANDATISCHVRGFLWLLTNRLTGGTGGSGPGAGVKENYLSSDSTWLSRPNLAWSLINQTQALVGGNFGITQGILAGSTTKYEKQYNRSTIAQALVDMSQLMVDPIDFEFTPTKVFNTYASIGATRPDIIFEYPGGDILSIDATYDTEDMANEVIGLSQILIDTNGNQSQFTHYSENITAQATYSLRQQQFNSDAVDDSRNGLSDATDAIMNAKSYPIVLPALTINGNKAPTVTDFNIGDRVIVKVSGHPLLSDINGFYRIEKYTLSIDNGENETIAPEFSNLGLATNTAEYDAGNALIREVQNLRQNVNRIRTTNQ